MRGRIFNWAQIGRAAALALGVVAILAAAVELAGRVHKPTPPPVPTPDRVDAGLERCRALGTAAVDDAQCQAVWAEVRRRFFASRPKVRSRP